MGFFIFPFNIYNIQELTGFVKKFLTIQARFFVLAGQVGIEPTPPVLETGDFQF